MIANTFWLLAFAALVSLGAGSLAAADEGGPSAKQLASMQKAIREHRSVTPDMARIAVSRFAGVPMQEVKLTAFYDRSGYQYAYEKTGFSLRVERDRGWEFEVRAGSGRVIEATWWIEHPDNDVESPVIPRAQADAIAMEYARRHIPNFEARRWHREVSRTQFSRGYYWWELLGDLDVRAPMEYEVDVDHVDGRVTFYREPTLPSLPPLRPQVSYVQARKLALVAAPYDPAETPFSGHHLEADIFPDGTQGLTWVFAQPFPFQPEELEEEAKPEYRSIMVDAISGWVHVDVPIGADLSGKERKPKLPKPDLDWITLRHPKQESGLAAGKIRDGRLWIKAESLRLLGVTVNAGPKSLTMKHESVVLPGKQVRAEFRSRGDYAWWVPLRRVVTRFGWRLIWNPKAREVLLDGPPAPEFAR